MKTLRSLLALFAAALGTASLISTGCSAQEKKTDAAASAANPASAPAPSAAPDLTIAATAATVTANDSWDAVKDYAYDQRAAFAAGLHQMTDRMDAAITTLNARRATLPQTSIKDWDFAMKELADARSDLRYQVGELDKATPETWGEVKEKLSLAWQRTKDAFDKVRTSTTT